MKKFVKNLSVKKILYALLVFVLAISLVLCSFAMVLRITLFNQGYLSDTLNSSHYHNDLCTEITDDLTDLGDASGLKKSFFSDLVDEIMVREDVQAYINSFYEGEKLKVNTSRFDDRLQSALNKYIKKNKIKNVDEDNIISFSAKASKIYAGKIQIKYLGAVQDLVLKHSVTVTIAIVVLILVIAAIICLLLFTNEWKHRALRYIYTALSSAGLFLLAFPVVIFASGTIGHIAIISRSLSDLIVSAINGMLYDLIIISVVMIVISIAVWVIYGKVRKKATI